MDLQFVMNLLNKNYDMKFDGISLLRDWAGCVCAAACGGKRYVVKNYRSTYIGKGMQSIEIMSYLHQAGYPVPAIIPTNRGLSYFQYTSEDEERIGVLFEFIKGIDPQHIAPKNAAAIGERVAKMHNLMQDYPGNLISYGREYFVDRYVRMLREKKYPEEKVNEYAVYGAVLWEKVKDLPKGFSHGDLHTGNMIRTPAGEYFILDFDLASHSFPSFDVMTLCDRTHYFDFKPGGIDKVTRMLDDFIKGYSSVGSITKQEIDAVYHFIAIRHYQLQAVILDLFGLDCVDEEFHDKQLAWIERWLDQCAKRNIG